MGNACDGKGELVDLPTLAVALRTKTNGHGDSDQLVGETLPMVTRGGLTRKDAHSFSTSTPRNASASSGLSKSRMPTLSA